MTTFLSILEHPVVRSLGWALLHFVWQATALAGIVALLQILMRRTSAQMRYVMLCGMLAVVTACPAVTWYWIASAMPDTQTAPLPSGNVDVAANHESAVMEPVPSMAGSSSPAPIITELVRIEQNPVESPHNITAAVPAETWNQRLRSIVEPLLPWLVATWWLGVIALSLRLLVGWRIVQWISRQQTELVAEVWQDRLKSIAGRLQVFRPIRLVETALVDVPTVIGCLRPVILLPASFLTGLTPDQVESVLAHEVAHIRRHDFLVNLVQTAVEVLLFYHPAVWWLSNQIREEREHCCDDIAVAVCGDRITYVRALTAMEQLRSGAAQPVLTVAASGGSLLQRIRRLAHAPTPAARGWTRGSGLSAIVAIAVLGLTIYTVTQSRLQAQPLPEPTNALETADAAPIETDAPVARLSKIPAQVEPGPVDPQTAVPSTLSAKLEQAITAGKARVLTANAHSPWQIFQGILALKQDFQIKLGAPAGHGPDAAVIPAVAVPAPVVAVSKEDPAVAARQVAPIKQRDRMVNAIEWISTSEPRYDNQPLIQKTQYGGKFHSFTRPYAFQGHPGQFLAWLSESDLPLTHTFKVGADQISINDIVQDAMKEVNDREEVTWVLWGLQHYLKPDAKWVSKSNEPWSIERLVEIETAAPVVGSPDFGNPRLFVLTRARDTYLKQGGTLQGVWAKADEKIKKHIDLARTLQNYDGSFSAKGYENHAQTFDVNQRLHSTGSTLDFLSIALPENRLREPWVEQAVTSLCDDLITNRKRQLDCGPLYHSLNALMMYRERAKLALAALPVDGQAAPVAQDAGWGPESNGLRFRIVPVPAATDAENPDISKSTSTFANSDDMTFAVEVKNVSDKSVTVLGVRYGESYPTAAGKLNMEFFGPHLFELQITDTNGKAVPQVSKTFERDMLILSGASAHVLQPGKSLVELIRPAQFMAPMDYRLPAGQYGVKVRYQGPDAETVAAIKKHWPDKPQASAWIHSAMSNEVALTIAQDPSAPKAPELVWGPVKDGLQAAIEFRKVKPKNGSKGATGSPTEAPGVPVNTTIGVIFHVKNVSDKNITFASETGRQGDTIHVKDAAGKEVPVSSPWFTGLPIMVRWVLKPGEVAQLSVLSPGVSGIEQPGKFDVSYTIRFNSIKTNDYPRKDDWQSELETGTTHLFLRARTPLDDANERPPTFTGRIEFVGPNGQPIEKGTFTYHGEIKPYERPDIPIHRGPIEIPDCSRATSRIIVRAPGYEEAYFMEGLIPNEIRRFELIPALLTHFKLVSPDGTPIAGAKVRFFNKTCGLASSGPIPMHGLEGRIWTTSQADGSVTLDSLQKIDPYYKDLGDAVYFFCVEAPAAANPKLTPPPRVIGPIKAGQEVGEIKLGPPLEVKGEFRGTPEELKNFAAEWDQPFTIKTDNPDGAWDYAVSQRLVITPDGDKLTFQLTGLTPSRLRIISNFGPAPHSVQHTYGRRDPKDGDVVVTIDLTESLTGVVITPKGRQQTPKP